MGNLCSSRNALCSSIESGDEAAVRRYIRRVDTLNFRRTKTGDGPIHIAAVCGHTDVVALLLEEGADVDYTDAHGRTALYTAALAGHIRIVTNLLACGANVHIRTGDGINAVFAACWRGYDGIAKLLLPISDLTVTDNDGRTCAAIAREWGHFELADLVDAEMHRRINTTNGATIAGSSGGAHLKIAMNGMTKSPSFAIDAESR